MKKIVIFIISCCMSAFLMSCAGKESAETGVMDTERIESESETVKSDIAEQTAEKWLSSEAYQTRAIRWLDYDYVSLNHALYRVDAEQQMEQIMECEAAVGRLWNDCLYWGVWDADHNLRIIAIDEKNHMYDIGEIEDSQPPAALDFYGDVLYIQFKLGNVVGYRIGSDGKLTEPASSEEMQLYGDENQAAEIRIENPDNKTDIFELPYHIVGAGLAKETTGQEFLAKHIQEGEIVKEEFIVRKGGKDTVLFTFYDDAVIDRNQVIYFSSFERNRLSLYDMQKDESKEIYAFTDGSFELLAFENNRIYGIWSSIEQAKDFFVGIDLNQSQMQPYFEVEKGAEYIVLKDTVYYADQTGGVHSVKIGTQVQEDEGEVYALNVEHAFDMRRNADEISDYYITNAGDFSNLYLIDEDGILWGSGYNNYGQLGQGYVDQEFHEDWQLIAENVVHVDYTQYGFVIYLTAEHELYGIGCDASGTLLQRSREDLLNGDIWNKAGTEVTSPVLLMEDVAYARCGREDVAALKQDGSLWTWGILWYEGGGFCYKSQPEKILDDVKLVTGGLYNHAALKTDGTVWTWGYNYTGNCGVEGKTCISEPQKVAENVKRVWTGRLNYSTGCEDISEFEGTAPREYENTVIETVDGELFACGKGLGHDKKVLDDYYEAMDYEVVFTSKFVPIEIVEE